ncbi:PHB depolymerase family esterase [Niallia sp. XMNu-256]|uniref:extracellular catalytic domain type 1 short-chain-length polyhydroxyalkanoate depolymerase n=1 Tax=Niallia sp. XMNu-256 TaxID=3082444 RepID=UPI0030D27CBE
MGEFKEYQFESFMYKLYVPRNFIKEKDLPLIVMLHGCKQDTDQFAEETKMNSLAEKEGFILLYPQMDRLYNYPLDDPRKVNVEGCWNWFLDSNQHRGKGLPKSIVDMIYHAEKILKNDYHIQIIWNKVFAAGLSAGGAMACILGVTYPDIFSGIAIVAGLPYDAVNSNIWLEPWTRTADYVLKYGVIDPYECGNTAFTEMKKAFKETGIPQKMPVIVFHGVSDTRVYPINGEQLIIQWAQTNFRIEGGIGKVNATPSVVNAGISTNGRGYTQQIYKENNNTPLMEYWLIHGMHHAWPGGNENGIYTDPLGPDAASIIWDFFTKTTGNQSQQ